MVLGIRDYELVWEPDIESTGAGTDRSSSAPSISMPLPFGIGDSAVGRLASLQPSGLLNATHKAGLQQSMPACNASTGALLVSAPTGSAVLLGGLAAGRLARQTALVSLVADILLVPVARRMHGSRGGMAAIAIVSVIIAKRLAGNAPPPSETRWTTLRNRLLFDRD